MKPFELYNTLSAAKLFSYNLISFDGVSCKSRNTSEYKLGDKHGSHRPWPLFHLIEKRHKRVI